MIGIISKEWKRGEGGGTIMANLNKIKDCALNSAGYPEVGVEGQGGKHFCPLAQNMFGMQEVQQSLPSSFSSRFSGER